jgi:Zn-finger nucleic acid-binding protein
VASAAFLMWRFFQRRSQRRYDAHTCPRCEGVVQWIPEAPGSLEGKSCQECKTVWTDRRWMTRSMRRKIVIHPYWELT